MPKKITLSGPGSKVDNRQQGSGLEIDDGTRPTLAHMHTHEGMHTYKHTHTHTYTCTHTKFSGRRSSEYSAGFGLWLQDLISRHRLEESADFGI